VFVVNEKKKQLATETVDAQSSAEKHSEEAEDQLEETKEALEKEKAKSDDYLRQLQYLQADFENYRKRVEREMADNRQFGNLRLLSDLIVVNDELELALKEADQSKENPTIVDGIGMVHKRLMSILSKEGVQKIQSLGSKFNPDLHEAALRVESDEEDGTVMEEIRQGYTLRGKVLRPSIVKVAENSAERESKSEKSTLEEIRDNE
jgi:molecular chaperone GrpE